MESENMRPWEPFDMECSSLRKILGVYAPAIKSLMGHPRFSQPPEAGVDYGEMKANVMLAYRHLEDAMMRLGKAIQAYDGGKSVYEPVDAARVASRQERK